MTFKCLELAFAKTAIPFKLILVETGGNHFSNYHKADIYIREREVTSSTISMNRAFDCVRTKYTILLTNDVFVDDGWIEALIQPFAAQPDCWVSTLASTQFNHVKRDYIEPDGIWFSVAMWRSGERFDERFSNVWDDTDLTMRFYLSGGRSYRNHGCVVEHLVGKTQYIRKDHDENFLKGQQIFRDKYDGCTHEMYTKLAGL